MNIKIYGADWCPDCVNAKNFLKSKGVEFEYIIITDNKEATSFVEKINDGKRVIPVEDMVQKIRAAVDARTDPDFTIIVRTDALAVTDPSYIYGGFTLALLLLVPFWRRRLLERMQKREVFVPSAGQTTEDREPPAL